MVVHCARLYPNVGLYVGGQRAAHCVFDLCTMLSPWHGWLGSGPMASAPTLSLHLLPLCARLGDASRVAANGNANTRHITWGLQSLVNVPVHVLLSMVTARDGSRYTKEYRT